MRYYSNDTIMTTFVSMLGCHYLYYYHIFQLFGIKPRRNFPAMQTSEFAEHFMGTIKAPDDCRMVYISHLALLVSGYVCFSLPW